MQQATTGSRWEGKSEKALLLGGHLDSVPNGGWLDGCLDFLAGFEVLRRFAERGRPPVTIRLVDWADEEGARFWTKLIRVVGLCGHGLHRGRSWPHGLQGIRLEDALKECGVDIEQIGDAVIEQRNAAAYLELHIEQGPVLEKLGAAARRGAGYERRGTACDYIPWSGSAFRLDANECEA